MLYINSHCHSAEEYFSSHSPFDIFSILLFSQTWVYCCSGFVACGVKSPSMIICSVGNESLKFESSYESLMSSYFVPTTLVKSSLFFTTTQVDSSVSTTSLPAFSFLELKKNSMQSICVLFIFIFLYCPYLSTIHEKANGIAIIWTVSSHSLGSCLFRGLSATCLPHKGGGVQLSALPKATTSELAGLFFTTSHKYRAPSRKAVDTIFLKVFWYDSTREMNPRFTDCEAAALTTTPSRRCNVW